MLNYICKLLKISCYAFDITNKCFIKTIAKSRNVDALVYYCMNNHMYPITNKIEVDKTKAIEQLAIIEKEKRELLLQNMNMKIQINI